jgi:hypothetical protein
LNFAVSALDKAELVQILIIIHFDALWLSPNTINFLLVWVQLNCLSFWTNRLQLLLAHRWAAGRRQQVDAGYASLVIASV